MTAGGFSAEAFGGDISGLTGRRPDGEVASSEEKNAHMLFQSGALNEQKKSKDKEERWLRLVGDDGHIFQTRLEDSYFALEREGVRLENGALINPFELDQGIDLQYVPKDAA